MHQKRWSLYVVCMFCTVYQILALDNSAYPDAFTLDEPSRPTVSSGVNVDRLQANIDKLASYSDVPAPAVTRILWSANDLAARKFVKELMEDAGLQVREDAIGNIFGRWEGTDSSDGAVGTGSHTDAIPLSGKYDGVLGVLGAIEAIRYLQETSPGFEPVRPIDVIMFTSEEPTRFGFGCSGSRAMAAQPGFKAKLQAARDSEGRSFDEVATAGGSPEALSAYESVALSSKNLSAFVELHIEQGPLLEQEGKAIGIVTAIAAPAQLNVEFEGDGGHAGALLMPFRNDAGLAGAELALAVEAAVLKEKSNDTVGTTGVFTIQPGAVNSVPRQAHLEIDIRDTDGPRRDRVVSAVTKAAEDVAKRRNVRHSVKIINQDPPATSGNKVVKAAVEAVEALRLSYKMMPSRAYHDSLFMARICPTGMIFIPCRSGVSHRPDEFASKEDMGRGVQVLALTLAKLSMAPKSDCCH